MDPEVAKKSAVWPDPEISGGCVSRIGPAEGIADSRRPPMFGSRPHLHLHPAEVRGGASGWIHQVKECYPHRKNLWWSRQEFCWGALLGPRLLRHDRRSGRRSDPRVHQKARSRRPTA